MNEKDLKLTELDYAIANHHLQMLKAAIPYMEIPRQRALSLFVKWNELMRTMEFFDENGDGMMSVCSLEKGHTSPLDMLAAMKPYGNQKEQEFIDILTRLLSSRSGRSGKSAPITPEQILSLLPPEQQSRFETIQLMMQTLGQM